MATMPVETSAFVDDGNQGGGAPPSKNTRPVEEEGKTVRKLT